MTIFSSSLGRFFKKTIESIITDDTSGYKDKLDYTKWIKVGKMDDAYEDDVEVGGPGLAAEVPEGSFIPQASISEGYRTRYIARKFGLRMDITEETLKDNKYDEAIQAASRLMRSLYYTVDIDCTRLLARAFNTDYVYGNGQPLCSASQPLPGGGTFSNSLATPLTPSRLAFLSVVTLLKKMPSQDGQLEMLSPLAILCPLEQEFVWKSILGSEKAPENDSNEINIVKSEYGGVQIIPIRHLTTTTTNWLVKTDSENGLVHKWRDKPASRTWTENGNQTMAHTVSGRWANGASNPRCVYGVNA